MESKVHIQPYKVYQLPITKIQYMSFNKKRNNSQSAKRLVSQKNKEKMPIQIVLDKISLQKKQMPLKRQESPLFRQSASPKNNKRLCRSSKVDQKQLAKVKPYVFQKFNYESYVNYQYKTSRKVFKYQQQNTKLEGFKVYERPSKLPRKVRQFDKKNIQVVFCENKYKDFVQKVNLVAEEQYMKKRTKSMSQLPNRNKNNHIKKQINLQQKNPEDNNLIANGVQGWNYSKYNSKTLLTLKNNNKTPQNSNVNIRNKIGLVSPSKIKSSLMNCLTQFKNLQKLSEYRQEQSHIKLFQNQNINKKQKLSRDDFSKTVSLSILLDKYPFLKRINKPLRQIIFHLIMSCDQLINGQSKINIHLYLKFNRIFIAKDANKEELGNFIYNLLFHKDLSFECGNEVLGNLIANSSFQTKENFETLLFELFNQNDRTDQQIREQITNNEYFCRILIQEITKK